MCHLFTVAKLIMVHDAKVHLRYGTPKIDESDGTSITITRASPMTADIIYIIRTEMLYKHERSANLCRL